ncbi:MAG: methyltransferase domain-containing protein [Pseudomonadota bacterium]
MDTQSPVSPNDEGVRLNMTAAERQTVAERADRQVARFRKMAAGLQARTCPICGYVGMFSAFGMPPRIDAKCGRCASLERHRLYALMIERLAHFGPDDHLLHFAPEHHIRKLLRPKVARYETADISARGNIDHVVDIHDTGLPSASFTRVICNHVLEHVDDRRALAEIHRLLKPGGLAFLTTPIIEGWRESYENAHVTTDADRVLHFGQKDHVRYFGRDLRDRIKAAGFEVSEYTAVEPDVLTYGLSRGETIFIAQKQSEGER